MENCKKEEAEKWAAGYVIGAGAIGAIPIPGGTSLTIAASQVTMCFHIGCIYRGDLFTLDEARQIVKHVGFGALIGRAVAAEALNFIPGYGWAAKSAVAGSVTAAMAKMLISYFEMR